MQGREAMQLASEGELKKWHGYLVVAIVSIVLYLNSLPGEFVFDDHEAIETNKDVRSDTPLSDVFSNDFWGFPLSDAESHKSYRPLTILTFRCNRLLHGMWAPGFHALNVLLHAAVTLLYTYLCSRLSTGHWAAVAAGLLFACHPIHTEVVANVVGRTELLSALFFLLSLLSYQQLAVRKMSAFPSALWFVSVVACSVLSLLSKEQGITVLAVCVAYDFIVVSRITISDLIMVAKGVLLCVSWKPLSRAPLSGRLLGSAIKRAFLLFGSLLTILLLRLYINGMGSPMFVESDNPASFSSHKPTRVLTYLYLCAVNMWLLLSPSRLCFDWSMGSIPLVESLWDPRNISTAAFFLFFGVTVLRARSRPQAAPIDSSDSSSSDNNDNNSSNNNNNNKMNGSAKLLTQSSLHRQLDFRLRKPPVQSSNSAPHHHTPPSRKQLLLFAIAFMALPFLPASNLFFPVGFVLAERILYLPSMGACLMVAIGMEYLLSKGKFLRAAVGFLLVVTVLCFSAKTLKRNYEWMDTKLLSESALPVNPGNAKVHMTLGNYYAQEGVRRCEVFYREALRLRPNYTAAWTNLGLVLLNTGRPEEAEGCYRTALSIKFDHINANTNMGHLCRLQGRWGEAKGYYRRALERRPNNPVLLLNLGQVLDRLGSNRDIMEAESAFRRCLGLVPGYADAILALGRLLATTTSAGKKLHDGVYTRGKRLDQAIHYLKQLQTGEAQLELGRIFLHKGELKKAERELKLALTLSPEDAGAYQELGNTYREAGEKEEAVKHYKKALELDPSNNDKARTSLHDLEKI